MEEDCGKKTTISETSRMKFLETVNKLTFVAVE